MICLKIQIKSTDLGNVCKFFSRLKINFNIINFLTLWNEYILECNVLLEKMIFHSVIDKLREITHGFLKIHSTNSSFKQIEISKITIRVNKKFLISELTCLRSNSEINYTVLKLLKILKETWPSKLVEQHLQICVNNKVFRSFKISAQRKDVTQYCYGRDKTRQMKLLTQQKKGK